MIVEHLSPQTTPLEMICLGTRNNNERDIFHDLMNKENSISTNIWSLDISPKSDANYIMDFNKLPKDWENKWDIIFSNSIDHGFDGNRCFTEWVRILKPGGLMYILFDNNPGLPSPEDCSIFYEKDITEIINNNTSNITVLNRFNSSGNNHLLVKKHEG
jgi:SAM-dependent methyltransferase